jgi:hypothetical protein
MTDSMTRIAGLGTFTLFVFVFFLTGETTLATIYWAGLTYEQAVAISFGLFAYASYATLAGLLRSLH